MKDEPDWGWADEEAAHGPFDSLELALEDARDYNSADVFEVEIGHCVVADPVRYIRDDLDDLLEQLDMDAEDEIFQVTFKEEAQKALTEILTEWASKYIYSDVWVLENTVRWQFKDGIWKKAKCTCCSRGDEYNGFSSGPLLFECPKHCSCHD
jgi:hypothetical protein